jgi:hypothetical protein
MNCSSCGRKFRLRDVTLADSNPPGIFLRIAVAFLALAAVGVFYNLILFLAAGTIVIITIGAVIASTVDNNYGYGKPKCPHCDAENTVMFWSH